MRGRLGKGHVFGHQGYPVKKYRYIQGEVELDENEEDELDSDSGDERSEVVTQRSTSVGTSIGFTMEDTPFTLEDPSDNESVSSTRRFLGSHYVQEEISAIRSTLRENEREDERHTTEDLLVNISQTKRGASASSSYYEREGVVTPDDKDQLSEPEIATLDDEEALVDAPALDSSARKESEGSDPVGVEDRTSIAPDGKGQVQKPEERDPPPKNNSKEFVPKECRWRLRSGRVCGQMCKESESAEEHAKEHQREEMSHHAPNRRTHKNRALDIIQCRWIFEKDSKEVQCTVRTQLQCLKKHLGSKCHFGVRYPCDTCSSVLSRKDAYARHHKKCREK